VRLAALLEDGVELSRSYQMMPRMARRPVGDTTQTTWPMTGSPRSNFSARKIWRSEKAIVKGRSGDCGVKRRDLALQLACSVALLSALA
jgi:hypothetical protein